MPEATMKNSIRESELYISMLTVLVQCSVSLIRCLKVSFAWTLSSLDQHMSTLHLFWCSTLPDCFLQPDWIRRNVSGQKLIAGLNHKPPSAVPFHDNISGLWVVITYELDSCSTASIPIYLRRNISVFYIRSTLPRSVFTPTRKI